MLIKNTEHLIKYVPIPTYRALVLDTYGADETTCNINDVTYRISVSNEYGGYRGLISTSDPAVPTTEQMWEYDHWLLTRVDKSQSALKQYMVERYADQLPYLYVDPIKYINDLVDLHIWLMNTHASETTRVDFSTCEHPLVVRAFETLKTINRSDLVKLLHRHDDDYSLKGYDKDFGDPSCVYGADHDIEFIDKYYGFKIKPSIYAYKDAPISINKSCTPEHTMLMGVVSNSPTGCLRPIGLGGFNYTRCLLHTFNNIITLGNPLTKEVI